MSGLCSRQNTQWDTKALREDLEAKLSISPAVTVPRIAVERR